MIPEMVLAQIIVRGHNLTARHTISKYRSFWKRTFNDGDQNKLNGTSNCVSLSTVGQFLRLKHVLKVQVYHDNRWFSTMIF